MKGKIFVLCGKSASGKDTLLCKILGTAGTNKTIGSLPSVTTRPMRPGEQEGKEYNFVTDEVFEQLVREGTITCAKAFETSRGTYKYGKLLPSMSLSDDVITIGDIDCIKELRKTYGAENVIGVYLTASTACRHTRALMRAGWKDFDEEYWEHREEHDKVSYNMKYVAKYCKFIINTENATPTQLYTKFKLLYDLLKGGVTIL